jgi:hypothetical protein
MVRTSWISKRWWWYPLDQHTFFFIVIAHWNNSTQVNMSLNLDTLFRFRAYMFSAAYTNFIFFGLTWQWIESTIYYTRGEHANQYTTNAVYIQFLSFQFIQKHWKEVMRKLPSKNTLYQLNRKIDISFWLLLKILTERP